MQKCCRTCKYNYQSIDARCVECSFESAQKGPAAVEKYWEAQEEKGE